MPCFSRLAAQRIRRHNRLVRVQFACSMSALTRRHVAAACIACICASSAWPHIASAATVASIASTRLQQISSSDARGSLTRGGCRVACLLSLQRRPRDASATTIASFASSSPANQIEFQFCHGILQLAGQPGRCEFSCTSPCLRRRHLNGVLKVDLFLMGVAATHAQSGGHISEFEASLLL